MAKIWTCKIGEVEDDVLPPAADAPMREAVARAYRKITGRADDFIFSGWGGSLTEPERAVVENRMPAPPTEIDVAALRALLDDAHVGRGEWARLPQPHPVWVVLNALPALLDEAVEGFEQPKEDDDAD